MRSARIREGGFILPLVLVLVAVIALSLVSALGALGSVQSDLRRLRDGLELERVGLIAEARVTYLLTTEPLGALGVRVGGRRISREEEFGVIRSEAAEAALGNGPERLVRLDGRHYRFTPAQTDGPVYLLALQDGAGLFNWNLIDEARTSRFLQAQGVEEPAARALAGAAADFVDPDDLRRLNGAERSEYDRAGLAGPANQAFFSVKQIVALLGWGALAPEQQARILDESIVTDGSGPFNVHTAGSAALRAWFNLDERGAGLVRTTRETSLLRGPEDVAALTGVPSDIDELRIFTFPAPRMRLRLLRAGPAGVRPVDIYEAELVLGRAGTDRPFHFDRVEFRSNVTVEVPEANGTKDWLQESASFGDSEPRNPNRGISTRTPTFGR